MRPSTRITPTKIIFLRRTLVFSLLLLATLPFPAEGQAGGDLAPVRFSPAEFLDLRWLEGAWRGRMSDGTPFYERYTLVNDSTFAVEAFADSTLGAPRDIGRVSLRQGVIYREESSGERVPVTHWGPAGVRFGTVARGFTWSPGSDMSWTATIHRTNDSGSRRDIVYRIERFPGEPERIAAERAVLDYVDALYEVDPTRIERSVHPALAKVGFSRGGGESAYREHSMTFDQLRQLAGTWNRSGRVDPQTAVKEIVIFDVLDQTATAKLTADWGVDYLHLAKYDGRWQIVNVLWQSPPSGEVRR